MTEQALTTRDPYNRFRTLVKTDNVQERFTALLNERAPEFLASLLSLVSADRNLLECDPSTIFASAAKAAILRLPIAKELGYAWIVPFKREATFIIGWKGLVQLAIRTGQYYAINAAEIYVGEEITIDRLTGNIKLNGQRAGDEIIGYTAYMKLKNGFEKFLYMTREEIEGHAKKYSKSYGNPRSAWTTNFDEMAKKTVLRLLLSKYGLMSIEMIDSDAEQIPAMGDDPRLAMPTFDDMEVLDGELKEEPEAPAENPQDQLVAAVVEAGLSENEYAARKTLQKCTVEPSLEWFRLYRGWRDLGGDSIQAAKKANEGKVPA